MSSNNGWVESAARAGYAAKGAVYAVIGGLAVQYAVGSGGETSGSREALREIAEQSYGQILLGIVTIGLAGYVVWRLVQAFLDPEGDATDDGDAKRIGKRAFYFVSAVLYGLLAYYGATLVLGSGGGAGGGTGGGSGSSSWVAELMSMPWGLWLVGIVGAGTIVRGLVQFGKAYTESFKERIQSFDLSRSARTWVMRASRVGLTARGVVFVLIGGSIIYAAVTHNPQEARGLEGVLELLVSRPWLLGAVGVGLFCYAIYQWVKARYRLIAV